MEDDGKPVDDLEVIRARNERDKAWRSPYSDGRALRSTLAENDRDVLLARLDAAEARVKELETFIKPIDVQKLEAIRERHKTVCDGVAIGKMKPGWYPQAHIDRGTFLEFFDPERAALITAEARKALEASLANVKYVGTLNNQFKVYVDPFAQASTPVLPSPEDSDKAARDAYYHMTDNDPKIHSNRFPTWDELSEEEREKWRMKPEIRTPGKKPDNDE